MDRHYAPDEFQCRLKCQLYASAAIGVALAAQTSIAADICTGGGLTTVTASFAAPDQCVLDAGESVVVSSSGVIQNLGVASPVDVTGAAASIQNAGSITGGMTAITIETNQSLSGSLINSGTITGGTHYGVYLDQGSNIAGGISNSGTIGTTSRSGVYVFRADVPGGITNSGVIDAATGQSGISVFEGNTIGSITNSGTITPNFAGISLRVRTNLSGSLTNSGTITGVHGIEVTTSSTVSGNITNSGVISTTWRGIYVGITTSVSGSIVNSGTITTTSSEGIEVTISNIGSIENTGVIDASGDDGIRVTQSTVVGGIVNASGATIRGTPNAIWMLSNFAPVTVANSGLIDGNVVLDDGRLNLLGENSRVTGAITGVAGSIVDVQGEFTSENTISVDTIGISSQGTLGLAHNVTSTSGFTNAGTLAIGRNSINVTGNYTQSTSGTFEIEAKNTSQYGQINISGTADLSASNGLNVVVGDGDSLASGQRLDDVISAGTLNAANIEVSDNSVLFEFTPRIDGNTLDLLVGRRTFEEVISGGSFRNGRGIGRSLDGIADSSPTGDLAELLGAIETLPDEDALSDASRDLAPVMEGNAASETVELARAGANRVVVDRLAGITGLSAGNEPYSVPALWIEPFGGRALQERRNGVTGFSSNTAGLIAGLEFEIGDDILIGGSLAYAQAEINSRGGNGGIDIQTGQTTFYGTYDLTPATFVEGLASFGLSLNDSKRKIDFGSIDRTARADYTSMHASIAIDLGHRLKASDRLALIPQIGFDYAFAYAEDYSEFGAGAANLLVDDTDADSLMLKAATRFDYTLFKGVVLKTKLELSYDLLAGDDQLTATFQGGGPAFTVDGLEPDPWATKAGIALELSDGGSIRATAGYQLEARRDFVNHKASINLRWGF